MIIAAAIIVDGHVRSLPPPARHHDIISRYPRTEGFRHGAQGFIDDKLGFVDRVQAAQIALNQGQVKELTAPPRLYSEDLW